MERTQVDGDQDAYSDAAALTFEGPDAKDMTRQEFKDDADINKIMARFGYNLPQKNGPAFSEIDWTIDLQQAFTARDELEAGFQKLPEAVRRKYPGWIALSQAMARGELKPSDFKDGPVPDVPPAPAPDSPPIP